MEGWGKIDTEQGVIVAGENASSVFGFKRTRDILDGVEIHRVHRKTMSKNMTDKDRGRRHSIGIGMIPNRELPLSMKSATFNTTVNRLTSLLAGTVATLLFHYGFDGRPVQSHEWGALGVSLISIGFLAWAGARRETERRLMRDMVTPTRMSAIPKI